MKDKSYIKEVEISVNFGETINMGDFSNIQPTYGEKLIIDTSLIPEGMTLDDIRQAHIDYVRTKYSDVRHQELCDFLNYVAGISQHRLPKRN